MSKPTFMTTDQVADLLGISPRTVEGWRYRGGGPPFKKLGQRVRYLRSDVLAWADSRTKHNTSQQLGAAFG